jgi:hypothetical protein
MEQRITVNINLLNRLVAEHFNADSAFALEAHTWNTDIKLGAGAVLNIDFSIRIKEVKQIADSNKAEADQNA